MLIKGIQIGLSNNNIIEIELCNIPETIKRVYSQLLHNRKCVKVLDISSNQIESLQSSRVLTYTTSRYILDNSTILQLSPLLKNIALDIKKKDNIENIKFIVDNDIVDINTFLSINNMSHDFQTWLHTRFYIIENEKPYISLEISYDGDSVVIMIDNQKYV